MSKQTAVEWLIQNIVEDQTIKAKSMSEWISIFEEAKEMEKEQIIDIDYRLSVIEDYAKGEAGDEITNLRKYINENYGN
jgi:hypothetical protein